MTEVSVQAGTPEGVAPEDESAHQAAVYEGASAAQAELAGQAAGEAREAAQAALEAARANIEAQGSAGAAAEVASEAAASTAVTAEMIHDALLAQGTAISALVEELKASRQQVTAPAPKKRKADREPRSSGTRLVRR